MQPLPLLQLVQVRNERRAGILKKMTRGIGFFWKPKKKSYGCFFQQIVVPQNGWFIRENPIKMDDLGVPLFSETPVKSLDDDFPWKRAWNTSIFFWKPKFYGGFGCKRMMFRI